MFSVLDSWSSGLGSSPRQGTTMCSRARRVTLTVPLFTQVYKWVLAKFTAGGNPAMD